MPGAPLPNPVRPSGLALALVVAAAALGAFLPGEAAAQCAMCRTALEQNPEVAAGFNRAIVFLLATPYAVFGSLAGYVLLSRRKRLGARQTREHPISEGGERDHSGSGTA